MKHLTVTVTLRKLNTGYKVVAFNTDNMDHAYAIAQVLVASPAFSQCYAVGQNWQGETTFQVGQQTAPPAPQYPQMAPPQYGYAQPQYVAPQYEYAPQPYAPAPYVPQYAALPPAPAYEPPVLEAEILPESSPYPRFGR